MASTNVTLRVWRGDAGQGELTEYEVLANEGEVILDILHRLQATQAGDLAVRWNCKAGKCGSCSMEINGMPRLGCMTRMNTFAEDETLTITPLRTFPVISIEHDPHLPALQFHRMARSLAWVAWSRCRMSRTTSPSFARTS